MTTPQQVRPAASVVLLRPSPDTGPGSGFEVFTITRATTMVFAGGMTAFPGGGVDRADSEPVPGWVGPDIPWWAAALGSAEAGHVVLAAIRELYEEVGVLLASTEAEGEPAALTDRLHAARDEIAGHRLTLPALLAEQSLMVRSDLLRPWANWITPPGQSRRYDTFFFVAALPSCQQAVVHTTEAETGCWASPDELLERYRSGALTMMPPTVVVLSELANAGSVEQVLATPRRIRPVRPELISGPGEPLRIRVNGVEIGVPGRRTES